MRNWGSFFLIHLNPIAPFDIINVVLPDNTNAFLRFQVNFFSDHTKLVVSKLAKGGYQLMYINGKRQASVFDLEDIAKFGCTNEIRLRIQYTMMQLQSMLKPWMNSSSADLY